MTSLSFEGERPLERVDPNVPFERLTRQPHLVQDGEIRMFGIVGPSDILSEARVRASLFVLSDFPIIRVRLKSRGGDLHESKQIYALLRECGKPIHATIEEACSGASIIAMAADHIEIVSDGFFMVHAVAFQCASIHDGMRMTAVFLRQAAERLENEEERKIDIYARRTGLDRAKLRVLIEDETFIWPEEAVRLGFADCIAGQPSPSRLRIVKGHQL